MDGWMGQWEGGEVVPTGGAGQWGGRMGGRGWVFRAAGEWGAGACRPLTALRGKGWEGGGVGGCGEIGIKINF